MMLEQRNADLAGPNIEMSIAGPLIAVIAVLEGFTTLSVEVIAIRLAVPIVGSSIVLTGITLGAVLLALSAGYWAGGALSSRLPRAAIRGKLAQYLAAAAVLYAIAFALFNRSCSRRSCRASG
jgi:hypothetical protein